MKNLTLLRKNLVRHGEDLVETANSLGLGRSKSPPLDERFQPTRKRRMFEAAKEKYQRIYEKDSA